MMSRCSDNSENDTKRVSLCGTRGIVNESGARGRGRKTIGNGDIFLSTSEILQLIGQFRRKTPNTNLGVLLWYQNNRTSSVPAHPVSSSTNHPSPTFTRTLPSETKNRSVLSVFQTGNHINKAPMVDGGILLLKMADKDTSYRRGHAPKKPRYTCTPAILLLNFNTPTHETRTGWIKARPPYRPRALSVLCLCNAQPLSLSKAKRTKTPEPIGNTHIKKVITNRSSTFQ